MDCSGRQEAACLMDMAERKIRKAGRRDLRGRDGVIRRACVLRVAVQDHEVDPAVLLRMEAV